MRFWKALKSLNENKENNGLIFKDAAKQFVGINN